ncbi:ABC transporter permease [Actimicrobium sp. CCI2.3]|uniref:ABC transporter permease n=1 Tax=Actimicrobium sp. CCI2.3 TaxID=3048616 RepID=UPI002AB4CC7D|nr:ABC transporter permease [Actimicrobium sp. CCI2.3]MDY7576125.1 ABC transporter permease [Actimicrobium sp. CCI2.3]
MNNLICAFDDVTKSLVRNQLFFMLGWQDVKQRYKRSKVGPFWLTISMGVMILTIGLVFGRIFKTPITEFLPFLTLGLMLWGFIFSCITEGCTSFISSAAIIKQLSVPLPIHVFRVCLWRNDELFGHNCRLHLSGIFMKPVYPIALLSLLGILLLVLNVTWMALLLGVMSSRFRDIPQLVQNLFQVIFYLTPIIWMPHLLPARASTLMLDWNPFYHMLEIVRSPLLGIAPSATSWLVSIAIAIIGWLVSLSVYGICRNKIAYWL